MKKLTATLSLCALAYLFAPTMGYCADASATQGVDLAAKAQSLKDDAQTRLNAMKDSPTAASDSSHAMALEAQKTAADIAVKAHATANEWTNHADLIAQSAKKLSPTTTAASATTAQTVAPKTLGSDWSKTKAK